MQQPFLLRSWPRAIVHIDADAFFASVEQAIHPALKGKPVITGAERGIVAAASYEAKALGIQRGVSLTEAAHLCPGLIMLPSDYETYGLFSKRMFAIMRRFTPDVEEYSIDEAFADLTGLRRMHRVGGYQQIAKTMQETIITELDIGVSVGLSLSKSLAKLCSKFRKPRGCTAVPGNMIHELLARLPLETVWGFGRNTVALLEKHGCTTALDFANKPRHFAEKYLGKNGVDIWTELRGEYTYKISTAEKDDYATISKSKTFSPSSCDTQYVFAQALRNLESACIKARRYDLAPQKILLYLREQNFKGYAGEATLNRPSNSPLDLSETLRELFHTLHRATCMYRATGVMLKGLRPAHPSQMGLFEDPVRTIKNDEAGRIIDEVNHEFGKHTLFLSEGLHLGKDPRTRDTNGRRGNPTTRKIDLLPGETPRKHLHIPRWHIKTH